MKTIIFDQNIERSVKLNGTTSRRQEDHAFFFHAILFEAEPNKYDCITYMANVGSTYQINCSSHHIW